MSLSHYYYYYQKQAIDIAARLSHGLRPAWGYASNKGSGKPFLPKEELHYLV